MSTYTVDPKKILTILNTTTNNADDLNWIFDEIVSKQNKIGDVITSDAFGVLTAAQKIMAIRAGWLG